MAFVDSAPRGLAAIETEPKGLKSWTCTRKAANQQSRRAMAHKREGVGMAKKRDLKALSAATRLLLDAAVDIGQKPDATERAAIWQHEVDQSPVIVNSTEQVLPPVTNLHIRLVHAPRGGPIALIPAHPLSQLPAHTDAPSAWSSTDSLPRRAPASSPQDPGSRCRTCSISGHKAG